MFLLVVLLSFLTKDQKYLSEKFKNKFLNFIIAFLIFTSIIFNQ